MKLSIITTIYQAEKDLPRLLDSMMAQKSKELEFFLINNGCTDGSAAICAEYAKKDSRFVIHDIANNIGYIAARNLGLKLVNADYVGFSDSDDFLEPGGYDKAIDIINKFSPDIYITSWNVISSGENNRCNPPFTPKFYINIGSEILPWAFGPNKHRTSLKAFLWKQVFKKEILANLNFDATLKPVEDMLFNAMAIQKSRKIYINDYPIYNYIVNQKSITAQIANSFDFKTEFKRTYLLYNALLRIASTNECRKHLANDAVQNILSLIQRTAKNKPVVCCIHNLSTPTVRSFIRESLKNCAELSLKEKFLSILLRSGHIKTLVILAKIRFLISKKLKIHK